MSIDSSAGRRVTLTLAGLLAIVSMVVVLAIAGTHDGHADDGHSHGDAVAAVETTNKQAALHDGMRKLWEDHITWTRLASISFAHDLPDLPATQARLLRNQVDIGNAIKPYYGRAAGNQLTALLMTKHLDDTLSEAVNRLQGKYAADARDYDHIHQHILKMADHLTEGITNQFPKRFR